MPRCGLLSANSLIDQKNLGMDFEGKADCLAFSGRQFRRQARVQLPHLHRLQPCGGRGCPGNYFGRSFRVLHLDQNSAGNQNAAIDFSKNIGDGQDEWR